MFTYQYQQPEEYHFSLDSIQFAEFISNEFTSDIDFETFRMLDLCAGCGVIGIQISWYQRNLRYIDFLEVQEIYSSYFEKNVSLVNRPELTLQWHLLNYDVLLESTWQNKYDLIVSNPPYFLPGHGMLSPSRFKNHCRFFLDSTFNNFILGMANALAYDGKAYFLSRPLMQHGYDMLSLIRLLLRDTAISIQKVGVIRGTDIIQLRKNIL